MPELDTDQITCPKYPYYQIFGKNGRVVACVKDARISCWGCNMKKNCIITNQRSAN